MVIILYYYSKQKAIAISIFLQIWYDIGQNKQKCFPTKAPLLRLYVNKSAKEEILKCKKPA